MKRLICFIMMMLLLTPTVFAAEEQMTFRMDSVTGNVGETVTVVGAVKNAPVCASFRVILTYDTSILEPVSCSKLDCKGLFMSNINATYKDQKAVNVLSADANKALEGDMKLFSVTFKILAETPGTDGTLINVAHQEFFDETPERVYPIIETCRIYVGSDTPGSSTPENPGDDTPGNDPVTTPDDPTDTTPDDPTDPDETTEPDDTVTEDEPTPDGDTATGTVPEDSTPEEPKEETEEEDKKPTGSWIVDEPSDEIYHVEEDGTTTIYVPEYVETPEPGKVTDVILKDKETGGEAGSIKVEGKEDGSFEVVEQDLTKDQPAKPGFPVWGWVIIGVAVAAVAAAAAWYFLVYRKKTVE